MPNPWMSQLRGKISFMYIHLYTLVAPCLQGGPHLVARRLRWGPRRIHDESMRTVYHTMNRWRTVWTRRGNRRRPPSETKGFSQDENQNKLTQGLLTYACHWLARVEAEWGDKTSWKECTCRSAVGQSDWRVHWCGPAPVEVQEEYTPL